MKITHVKKDTYQRASHSRWLTSPTLTPACWIRCMRCSLTIDIAVENLPRLTNDLATPLHKPIDMIVHIQPILIDRLPHFP